MRLKIKGKLIAGFSMVILLLFLVGVIGVYQVSNLNVINNDLVSNNVPSIIASEEMEFYVEKFQVMQLQHVMSSDDKQMLSNEVGMRTAAAKIKENVDKFASSGTDETDLQYLKEFMALWELMQSLNEDLLIASHANDELKTAEVLNKTNQVIVKIEEVTEKMVTKSVNNTTEAMETGKKLYSQSFMVITTFTIIAIILGVGTALYLARSIVVPIQEVSATATKMAGGDLTVKEIKITSTDESGELATAFNQMLVNMKSLITKTTRSAEQVASTSQELSATSEQATVATQQVAKAIEELARGATEQNAGISQTASSVDELSRSIGQIFNGSVEQAQNVNLTSQMVGQMAKGIDEVACNTQKVAEGAKRTAEVADKGGQAISDTIEGMKRIKDTVFESANKIRELGDQSKQIGEIIQVIDDIAEQTNLLALNAAIEAARAGEHGKGFAVVADEVRKLAERSGKATKEIANLIINIQKGTTNAVQAMEIGTKEVEKGVVLADNAGVALQEIRTTVQETNDQILSITAATEEISASSSEVVMSIDNVAAITQQNTAATQEMAARGTEVTNAITNIASIAEESAASSEEISASTEELNASLEEVATSAQTLASMAQELRDVVMKFRV
ncbi:MAG: methyl-accepting chemotaxis protein [Thermincolia bacterium]